MWTSGVGVGAANRRQAERGSSERAVSGAGQSDAAQNKFALGLATNGCVNTL